jgi:hypothetical protein
VGLFLEHLHWCSQCVTLDSKIKCLSLADFFFGDPTNKTVTGTAYTDELLITCCLPPRPIIMINQSEILSHSQVQFITLFFGGAQLCCAFHQPWRPAQIWCRKNQSSELNRHILIFFTINFTVWSHMLITGRGALLSLKLSLIMIKCDRLIDRSTDFILKWTVVHVEC